MEWVGDLPSFEKLTTHTSMPSNGPAGKLHEATFNSLLARALRDAVAQWRENEDCVLAERRGTIRNSHKRPDILVKSSQSPPVVIECAFGSDNDKDAKARLNDGDFDTAITLAIPRDYEELSEKQVENALRDEGRLKYAVLIRHGNEILRFPEEGYIQGAPKELAWLIPMISVPRSEIENVADKVAEKIDEAAGVLKASLSPEVCEKIAAEVYQRTALTAFRTVMVLWLDAMLVQSHLSRLSTDIKALSLTVSKPSELIHAWESILERNWNSVFAPAIEVLKNATEKARGATAEALRILQKAVEVIETARLGDHINIGAELFPKISEDRKEAAAFYTVPATAEFLASLLIRERDPHNWGGPELFQNLCVADFACGTGSLVRAAYRRIQSLSEASGSDINTIAQLHRMAMERGIKAADVSPIATHLTSSSMALLGSGEPYGTTSISWVSVGKPVARQKGLSTGSLEFLSAQALGDLFAKVGSSAGGKEDVEIPITVENNSVDYIIMNPPYSRTRKDQATFDIAGLTEEEREQCQLRWGNLLKKEDATKIAGMAASFLCIAKKKVKPGGRIGFVLPLTAAFNPSWARTRKMIVDNFTDIIAIAKAGSKGGKDALSADTRMGEMLLIATRNGNESDQRGGGGCAVRHSKTNSLTTWRSWRVWP